MVTPIIAPVWWAKLDCKCLKLITTFSHKGKMTYSVLFGASVLKAPVSTLLIVTVGPSVVVLVEVIVGSSSEILLNDMAMLETV